MIQLATRHHRVLVEMSCASAFFTNSGRHPRNEIHRTLIEARPTGSIWAVDLKSGKAVRLVDKLVMPNGLTLTHDSTGTGVIFCLAREHVMDNCPDCLQVSGCGARGLFAKFRAPEFAITC